MANFFSSFKFHLIYYILRDAFPAHIKEAPNHSHSLLHHLALFPSYTYPYLKLSYLLVDIFYTLRSAMVAKIFVCFVHYCISNI